MTPQEIQALIQQHPEWLTGRAVNPGDPSSGIGFLRMNGGDSGYDLTYDPKYAALEAQAQQPWQQWSDGSGMPSGQWFQSSDGQITYASPELAAYLSGNTTPQIASANYVPSYSTKYAGPEGDGFFQGLMRGPLQAGLAMAFGIPALMGEGAALGSAAGADGGLSWLGNSGLSTIPEAVSGMGAGTAAGAGSGLSWLGNEGLASIPDAVGSMGAGSAATGGSAMNWSDLLGFDTGSSSGLVDGFNPGAVMDAAGANAGYSVADVLNAAMGNPASSAGSSFLSGLIGKGGGSLLGTALGGLLGGVGGSKQAGTTTTTQEPWGPQQAYLLDAWNQARQAANGSPLQTQANSNYSSVLSGPTKNPYLGMDNPYLTKAIDYANQDTTRAMIPAMNQANRASGSFGNSGVADTFGRALTDQYGRNANSMRMTDYTNQQNLAQQQVNNTLGFTQNANNYAAQPAQNYAQTVQGNYGGSTSSPYFNNPMAGILGGAAIGNKIGSIWG